jgi:predicted DNA-binding transcriptional regulator
MSFQQHLMRRIWKPAIKQEIEIYMIVRGKILTAVRLTDIGKIVEYGREVKLTEYEVNRSKDLQNAISRCWVEVIYDRGLLKRALVAQNKEQEKKIENEVLDMAKKMACSMAEEMIKNSPLVREIAKEIAKEMVSEIKNNVKIDQLIIPQATEKKIEIDSSSNIFVDFKDEEIGMTTNIQNPGNIKVQKDDLTDSLERMKRFRKTKNEN